MALPVIRLNANLEGEIEFGKRKFGAPFALPGDLVQFRLKRGKKKSFKVLHIERAENYPSEIKLAVPTCPYYTNCGGCRGQHLAYDYQLDLKCAPVEDQMQTQFGLQPTRLASPNLLHYRHRMDFVVENTSIGLRAPGDYQRFIDIEKCAIQAEVANKILELVRTTLADFPQVARNRKSGTGLLKYITIRCGQNSSIAILTICNRISNAEDSSALEYSPCPIPAELQAEYLAFRNQFQINLAEQIPHCGLVECKNDPRSEVSAPPGGQTLLGDGKYIEQLGDLNFEVPYDGFFQPNPAAFDLLLNSSLQALAELMPAQKSTGNLTDLYCGSGILAAIAVHRFSELFDNVYGFESVKSAVERGALNLKHFKGQSQFEVSDLNKVEDALREHLQPHSQQLLIADPPRAGISKPLCELIRDQKPADFFLYISCNPQSQIRDLEILQESYQTVAAFLVDCYPHTPHLEQAVLLKLKN